MGGPKITALTVIPCRKQKIAAFTANLYSVFPFFGFSGFSHDPSVEAELRFGKPGCIPNLVINRL